MHTDPGLKEKLRSIFIGRRNQLSTDEVEKKSKRIIDQIFELKSFKEAKLMHSYVSIKKNHEVDTRDFIQSCLEIGKQVAIPKMIGEKQLQHIAVSSIHELRENRLGIPEPVNGSVVPPDEFSFIIVPMVAGDHQKNRIGYGAGYYDRFLTVTNACKVGLLFDCQLSDHTLPAEKFDVPLDILITESKIID